MRLLEHAFERAVYPAFRRFSFRGKGRLRSLLPVPSDGSRVVSFPGDVRLRLDLRESLQRDFLFGLYDQHELRLLRRLLARGGDLVDVGAHIGMYSIAAAVQLRGSGRVLAFEPNPDARAQLLHNVALNRCDNVVVSPCAVAAATGEAYLHVPSSADPSFSSLGPGRFDEGEPVAIATTTLDEEVARHGLVPVVLKIDVEGGELDVLAGAQDVLARRPSVLVEVGPSTAREVEERLAELGYRGFVVTPRSLTRGVSSTAGYVNALFLERETPDVA